MLRETVRSLQRLVQRQRLLSFFLKSVLLSCWEDRSKRRPIFIMSPASSGSTWIAAMLGHLPSHVYIHEVKLYGGNSSRILRLLLRHANWVPSRLLYVFFEFFERARLWTLDAHAEHLRDRPEMTAPYNLGGFRVESPQTTHGSFNTIDSAGGQIHVAPLIRSAYPRAILCYVSRDLRDTCASIYYRKPFGRKRTLQTIARTCTRTYEVFRRHQEPCGIDFLRYEDWLADARGQLAKFVKQHNLEMTDEDIDAAAFQHSAEAIRSGMTPRVGNFSVARAGVWKKDLGKEQYESILPILDSALRQCGYL